MGRKITLEEKQRMISIAMEKLKILRRNNKKEKISFQIGRRSVIASEGRMTVTVTCMSKGYHYEMGRFEKGDVSSIYAMMFYPDTVETNIIVNAMYEDYNNTKDKCKLEIYYDKEGKTHINK